MKKRAKKIIIIILIIIMASAIVFNIVKKDKQPSYQTEKVEKKNLIQTVDAIGSVRASDEIKLNFRTTGRIAKISVKEGDRVFEGQTLVFLESGALSSRVIDAESQLQAAQANMEKILAGASAEEIYVLEKTVEQKNQAISNYKDNLAKLQNISGIELENLKQMALVVLNNELITAKSALETIDNTLKDQDAQDSLSVLDSGALPEAENSQKNAQDIIKNAELIIQQINNQSSNEQVLYALDEILSAVDSVAIALEHTLDVLQKTITSNILSETELDALKSNIKADHVKINTARTNIQTANSNFSEKIVYYDDQISKAENSVKEAEKALDVANAQLKQEKAPPRDFEIKNVQSQILQAEASLKLAKSNLQDSIITAPISGIVTKINNKIGEQSSLSNQVLEMMSDSSFEVEAQITESDIAKIKTGQKTEITLDAYGDERTFQARVVFVDPAETVIQDVVYYKIKVQFDENCAYESNTQAANIVDCRELVKPGMTANLKIITDKRENALVISQQAVKSDDGEKYAQVLVDGKLVDKEVSVGMKGDDGFEIINGLSEGEEVITFIKNGE